MIKHRACLIVVIILATCTSAPFLQTVRHDFVNYDDPLYITANPHIKQGLTLDGIEWAFTRTYAGNWHPLTWISHMLDVSLFGFDAGFHHFVNLFWHVLNTVLLYLVLFKITGRHRASALTACLFALHPAHVESVAWISERKDLVSTFLGFACIGSYISYARNPSAGRYMIVFLLLALGLMAKPMLVTLPFLLLLLDFWPLDRFHGHRAQNDGLITSRTYAWIVAEKMPLLILSFLSSAITIKSHWQIGAIGSLEASPLVERFMNALVAYAGYIKRLVWPFDLVVFYPPLESAQATNTLPAMLLILGITLFALYSVKRRPYLIVGWLWYLGTLVPVIGLIKQGSQSMPDHFTYLSYVGLFIMVVWGMADLARGNPRLAGFFSVVAPPMLGLLMINAWIQTSYWSNSIVLFRHNLALYPKNAVAHHNLGQALDEKGRTDESLQHYRQALALSPHSPETLNNLGVACARTGNLDESLTLLYRAIAINPSHAIAHKNLGLLLNAAGQNAEAIRHLTRAIRILRNAQTDAWADSSKGYVLQQTEIEFHLGRIYLETGRIDRGITAYRRLESDEPELAARLAVAVACHYHHAGDFMQALVWGAKARGHDLFNPDLLRSDAGMERLCRSNVWLKH